MKTFQYLNNPTFKAKMPKISAALALTAVVSSIYLTMFYPQKVWFCWFRNTTNDLEALWLYLFT